MGSDVRTVSADSIDHNLYLVLKHVQEWIGVLMEPTVNLTETDRQHVEPNSTVSLRPSLRCHCPTVSENSMLMLRTKIVVSIH